MWMRLSTGRVSAGQKKPRGCAAPTSGLVGYVRLPAKPSTTHATAAKQA